MTAHALARPAGLLVLCAALLAAPSCATSRDAAAGEAPGRAVGGAVGGAAGGASPGQALTWVTLGTIGGPVPDANRSQPANLLLMGAEDGRGGRGVLVDVGDGASGRLAEAGATLGSVDAVFLSHLHLDHTAGLTAFLGLRWMGAKQGDTVTVYGPPGTGRVVEAARAVLAPSEAVGFGFTGAPALPPQEIVAVELSGGEAFEAAGLTVRVAENSHYSFDGEAPPPSRSLSYRFEAGGRSVVYTGDTGASDAVTALAEGADLLVTEVADTASVMRFIAEQSPNLPAPVLGMLRRHMTDHHLTPAQIGALAAKAGVGRVVLTHIVAGTDLEARKEGYAEGVREVFGGAVVVAEDLDRFVVGRAP